MDEGLSLVIAMVLTLLLIPIAISFFVLYAILRDKKRSLIGSIIGFMGAFVIGFTIPVSDGQSIIWFFMSMDMIAQSSLAPLVMATFFGLLTAFTGLIVIKIFWRSIYK